MTEETAGSDFSGFVMETGEVATAFSEQRETIPHADKIVDATNLESRADVVVPWRNPELKNI